MAANPGPSGVTRGHLLWEAQHAPTPEQRRYARRRLGLDPDSRTLSRSAGSANSTDGGTDGGDEAA